MATYDACIEIGRRIQTAQADLAAQSARYAALHPVIRRLRARLAAFERVLASLEPCPCRRRALPAR